MAYEISFPLDLHLQDDCSTFEALLSWFPLEVYDHAFCMELKYFARVMQMMNWSKRVHNSAFSHNDADSLLLFDKVIKALYDKQWALQKTHSYSDGEYAEKINEVYFKVSRATNISPPSLMIYLSNLQWLTAFKELNENDDLPFELPTFVANWLNSNNVSDYKAKNHIFKKESVYLHSHICAKSSAQTEITEKSIKSSSIM